MTTAALAELFGFTVQEAARNRAGQLSPRQRQQCIFASIGYIVRGLAVIVLVVVLATALPASVDPGWRIALYGMAGIMALLLIYGGTRAIWPPVAQVAGTLRRTGDDWHPQLQIGDIRLRITYRRWKHLPDTLPGPYRVYYTSTTHQLLSIEPEGS